jgi:Na+-translocating ferredoxin:NAD+ oxidoreductase RnfD subunit
MSATIARTPQAAIRSASAPGLWSGIPSLRDPRIPFALLLTFYALAGTLWLGFNRNPEQILITVASACGLDMALHWILRERRLLVPLSAYITGLSLSLVLNYAHDYFLLFFPVFMAIGSKYLFTRNRSHAFNPSLFGVTATLLLAGSVISTAPAYQWRGNYAVSSFIVMAALTLFVFKVDRAWLVGTFLISYAAQTALRAYVMRFHMPAEMLFLGTMSSPQFFLFAFYMITDPKTSPSSRRGQVGVAIAITLVDLALHLMQSVFTFFYAASIVQAARFLWGHGQHLLEPNGVAKLQRALTSRPVMNSVAVLSTIALLGGVAYTQVLRPRVTISDVGFRFEELSTATTGISVQMDPGTLRLVDPRLQHISKWLMSVGSSVAAADVTRSGRQDLFLSNPLAAAKDRNQLLINLGGYHFQRVPVPALDAISNDPQTYGMVTGGVFFDYDGDGYPDLFLTVAFGVPILLHNLYGVTGRVEFEDVSAAAGVDDYAISVTANVLDYDHSGRLSILLANVLNPYLPGYSSPTQLSIFHLPAPAYPGDRRMFKFMHNSWYDATNGGGYVLYRNLGGGRFEKQDVKKLGLPETHWSLSIGTGDLNGDGWTDLYVANDFGPDDVYINDHGRFHRLAGTTFGDVGKDTYKGMNSSLADLARTGRLDVYVSDVHHALQAEGSLLWMNQGVDARGNPILVDEASARGVLNEDRFGWGAAVGDLENRGWLDIVQANGHIDDSLDRQYSSCPDYWYINAKLMQSPPDIFMYADQWGDLRGACIWPNETTRVYYNRGADARPQFVDVAALTGLTRGSNSRGVALVDLDNTGRLDMVISNQFAPPSLYRNVGLEGSADWVGLRVIGDGVRCNADAVGSTISVETPGEPRQTAEAQAVTGFSAQGDSRVHFGLGQSTGREVTVGVRWCGQAETRYQVPANAYTTIREGVGAA